MSAIVENPILIKYFDLNYTALLADKRPNEVPFNRP